MLRSKLSAFTILNKEDLAYVITVSTHFKIKSLNVFGDELFVGLKASVEIYSMVDFISVAKIPCLSNVNSIV